MAYILPVISILIRRNFDTVESRDVNVAAVKGALEFIEELAAAANARQEQFQNLEQATILLRAIVRAALD